MTNVLVLTDGSNNSNWGSRAMVPAINDMLEDAIPGINVKWIKRPWLDRNFRRFRMPPALTVLYDQRRMPTKVAGILYRCSRPTEFFPRIVDQFEYMADEWMAGRGGPFADEFIAMVRESDVIVHNGAGHMHENKTAGCRALFLLWFAKTRLAKPACEINQSSAVSAMTHPIMPGMMRLVYPILDTVTAREPGSLRDLLDLGIENAQLVPDVVFYLDTNDDGGVAFREWKTKAGLDGRSYFCLSAGALPMDWARLEPETESSVVQLVRRLKQVVPQAVLIGTAGFDFSLEKVANITDSVYFGPRHHFREMWPLLKGASFQVNGHYHQVMAGAQVGCPFIPFITDTHKMEGLCEHLNWHSTQPYDPTALRYCTDSILAEAERLVRDRDTLSQQLLVRTTELKAEAKRNALLIRDLLSSDKERV